MTLGYKPRLAYEDIKTVDLCQCYIASLPHYVRYNLWHFPASGAYFC